MDQFQKYCLIKDFMARSGLNYQDAQNIFNLKNEKSLKFSNYENYEETPDAEEIKTKVNEIWRRGRLVKNYD